MASTDTKGIASDSASIEITIIDSIPLVFLFIFFFTLFVYRSSPAENKLRELHPPNSTIGSKTITQLLKCMSTKPPPVYTFRAKKR
jgi:hypothetical protein